MNDYEQLIEMMFTDGTLEQSVRQEIEGMNDLQKRLHIVKMLDKGLGLFTKIEGIMNLGKMDYIKNILMMLKSYVLIADVKQKEAGEVMTPLWFVKEMLSTLPEDFWSNPELKWLDPANGTGPYPIMVIYKLMVGLKDWEPDDEKRYKHIVEKMIYVGELQSKNMFLYMNAIDPMNEYNLNIYTGSFLEKEFNCHMKNVFNVEKFDVVIGNPPYQEMDGGAKASAKPIYNLFIEKSILISDKILFITPSRWFAGGKGLDTFRKMMMSSNNIKYLKHFPNNGQDIFGTSVNIGGGVSYFLFDNKYSGNCFFNGISVNLNRYDIILRDTQCYSIIDGLNEFIKNNGSLESISKPRSFYMIATNDNRLSDNIIDGYLKCYVSKHKGFEKYIDRNIVDNNKLNLHKVVTPRAFGNPQDGLGNIFYASPLEVVTDSYMFIVVNSENEASSLISFLKTKFVHYLVCLRKIDSSIKPSTFKWIPIPPLDRTWTDNDIFEYFNISDIDKKLFL